MKNKRFIVRIPIIRKNFKTTNSAKFKGDIFIICNSYGIIYDWRIQFKDIYVNLYITRNNFLKKKLNYYKRRLELFSKLNIKQKNNLRKKSPKIYKLDANQVEITNDYFNDRKKYKSTIKNIVTVIKGSSPCGEKKEPKYAEMIIDNDSNIKNFVILIDDLTMKNKIPFDSVKNGAYEKSFDDFVNLNSKIRNFFEYMQKTKDLKSWIKYSNKIKKYCKKNTYIIN